MIMIIIIIIIIIIIFQSLLSFKRSLQLVLQTCKAYFAGKLHKANIQPYISDLCTT